MATSRLMNRNTRDIANVMQKLQDEQEAVQKRTFTKWINSHLAKRNPPLIINDLFEDIKDGTKLLALLEVLSGQKLPCEQGRQMKRIHWVANIGAALKFLEGRRIKLVNINSTDIADGKPTIVLGLIWTIILYFQIEELTSNLPQLHSLSSSTSSVDSVVSSDTASPPIKRKVVNKIQGSAKKALLRWVQYTAAKRHGIEIKDFGPCWRNGIAFHSMIYAIRPELVDMDRLKGRSNRENLEEAFSIAETELGIPRLLEPEDVDVDKPDEKSIMTYIAQFLKHYPDLHSSTGESQQDDKEERLILRDLKVWIEQFERDISRAQAVESSLQDKYQSFKQYRVQYEMKRKQIESAIQPQGKDGKLSLDQTMLKQAWDKVSARILDWHVQLDKSLPAPLGTIGSWLYRADVALRDEINIQQSHDETANIIHRKLEQLKDILKNLDGYKKAFQEIHRSRSVNGVPVPIEQLEDMAERFSFVASSSQLHMIKLEFMELKYRLLALLVLAESKLKSWIIKYGRRESVELLLQNYITFIDGSRFFEQYEFTSQSLKQAAEIYIKAEGSAEEAESVTKFLNETTVQWRNLSVEVRSVRSMLEEVVSNWDKYSGTVASLQAWLEDAEKMLDQPEHAKKEFFRHLPHMIQQHTTMNDSGNFLIETCDDTVSKDIKQQLLLLNGRWRDLFMEVKHYARPDDFERAKKEYAEGLIALAAFAEGGNERISIPLEVSFLNVKMFVQDLEDIKQKMPIIEAQYKSVTRMAQLLTKESPPTDASEMLAAVARIKDQLNRIRERYPPLLYESQQLLMPLGEFESHMTVFYETLEKLTGIISMSDMDLQSTSVLKQKQRELIAYQESCKKALVIIEKNGQAVHKAMSISKSLHHFDRSPLQKKITDAQSAFQTMIRKISEWKKKVECNSSLMKKFEESRTELEKVLKTAEKYLKEKGNPEELLKKHTDFFGQLDQKVLNAFLKACDEMTDILPEQDQQSLQETVRKLHKQWKDYQSEAPYHLLHLKIELERNRILASVEDCRSELARENKMLPVDGSEKILKEHRAFFGEKGCYQLCEKRLRLIEELCLKLQERDPIKGVYESSRLVLKDLKTQIDTTHQKLMEHSDKWKDFRIRLKEVSDWLTAKNKELIHFKDGAKDITKYEQIKSSIQNIRHDVVKQEDNLRFLKDRLTALTEVSVEKEVRRQNSDLARLSESWKSFLDSLNQIEKILGTVGDCVECKEAVKNVLSALVTSSKDVQSEAEKILNTESLEEAQELLLQYEQNVKKIRSKKQDVQLQITRAKQIQIEKGLSRDVKDELLKMEAEMENVEITLVQQEIDVKDTVHSWEKIENGKESIAEHMKQINPILERPLNFGTLENLSLELQQTKEMCKKSEDLTVQAENLLKKSSDIKLGEKSKRKLLEKTKSVNENVKQIKKCLSENITKMEQVRESWQKFDHDFEMHSTWISDKEKELNDLELSNISSDIQVTQIKEILRELEKKNNDISDLEANSQSFAEFITTPEMTRIKSRLSQVGKDWDGLKEHAQRLKERILGHAEQQQKFDEAYKQIQDTLENLEAFLACPIRNCSSAAETYKVLNSHQDLCHDVETLKTRIHSLTASARNLTNKDKAVQQTSNLQQRIETAWTQSKERHSLLEQLLAHWQRQEKEFSSFVIWLERNEALLSPPQELFPADKSKIEAEMQAVQALDADLAQSQRYTVLVQLSASLYQTSNESCVESTRSHLEELSQRWKSLPEAVSKRISVLESSLGEHQKFDNMLLKLSLWNKQFLGELQEASEISTSNQNIAVTLNKKHIAEMKKQEEEISHMKDQFAKLCTFTISEDHHILQGRVNDCVLLYEEAKQIAERRQDSLTKLGDFLRIYMDSLGILQTLKEAVVGAVSLDKVKSNAFEKELNDVSQDIDKIAAMSTGLDTALAKAQYNLKNSISEQRTSCRALSDNLSLELEKIQTLLGTKLSEAEVLGALWKSFIDCREKLLKTIEDIEEKADSEGMKEPTLQGFQQRLTFFNELEEEINSYQHERQWLMDKAKQIAQKDLSLAAEADKELNGLNITWEDTKKLISDSQEQCLALIDLIKEYEHMKYTIVKLLETVENMITIKSTLKDQEDIRRTIAKHESAKNEITENQKELDEFTNKGKRLLVELKRIHGCDSRPVKKDLDFYVDQWLDVMERIDENLERLSVSLALWEDVLCINDDIDGWSTSSISQLNESITNLSSSQQLKACLAEFQTEVTNKGQKLEEFHSKVYELKELTKSQEAPAELQLMEADLRQKLEHAKEVSQVAKGTLNDFSLQKMQLETFIDQMTNWLNKVEESVLKYTNSQEPEDLKKLKEMQKEFQAQQSSIDTTQENLNTLCRRFRSAELEAVGVALTALTKKYEATNQLCLKTQAALQETLEKRFIDAMYEFEEWFKEVKKGIQGSSDWSGDSKTVEVKIQHLQDVLDSVSKGQSKLDTATEEGERLYYCLPKALVLSIQEKISKAEKEFQSFKRQCLNDKQVLEDCVSELGSFEDQHKKLSLWIHELEERIKTETLGESKQHIPEKKNEMHKVEMFLEELLAARDSFEKLCQRAQALHEDGRGDGQEVRQSFQLLTTYQNLVKIVKEKLRVCQVAVQEHQIFEEALQTTWLWLKDIQDKLSTTDSTVGSKSTLEKRQQQVQEIILTKGEGEVKLNLAIGKGEQALKSSNMDGQMIIQMQLQTLKDVWGTVNSTATRCLSVLEAVINQWNEHTERKTQMEQWLESVDHKLEQPLQPQNGLKEKFALLDHIQTILSDVEDHSTTLHHLIEKTKELHQKTEDPSFSEIMQNDLKMHFNDILTVAKEKMRNIEDILKDHLLYLDAVQEFTDWLHSAKEELHRWSDASGDSAAIHKKVTKIKELIDSRQTGAERLSKVETLAPAVKKNTTASGCEQIDAEIQGLQADWKQWEESVCQTKNTLETLKSQMAISEQEFTSQVSKLEDAVQDFHVFLEKWAQRLVEGEGKNTDREIGEYWHRQKDALNALTEAERITDDLKAQLNDLCRFSKDLSVYSSKVSALIKEYNRVCLQASKACQSKEQTLQQRFRTAFRDFQQWLVNAKVMTAKCFDVHESITEASASLERIQECLSESESGQQKLQIVISRGELLFSIMPGEKVQNIQKKVLTAKNDWKSFISSLHQKESALENLKVQMGDFETSAKPVQEWLSNTERIVQDSNNRLHDLPSKRKEQQKLQSILEEIACHEPQITRLKEKAQQLREGQSASKTCVNRVSQLSAQYLALNNLTKEKMSRMDRIVAEHQQFSQGLNELQDWIKDSVHMLQSYCHPTADKSVLDSRMSKVEVLLLVKQEKEIQMKMLLTRGESVLRNTSPEGAPAIQDQLQNLKDSWASLLSSCIQCKSQIEGALSKWTGYQDDVRQFSNWMDGIEERMNDAEKQYNELRDKIAAQSKAKLLNEEVISHKSMLDTIEKKGSSMAEHYVTQLEFQDLQERYSALQGKTKEAIFKADKLVSHHQDYQKSLRAFDDWLQQEIEKLDCLELLDGNIEMFENTLQELQEHQMRCAEGQALLNTALRMREEVILWGIPHTEDRELESLRQDWQMYQQRLTETRGQINAALSKLKVMERKFQKTDEWLTSVEGKVNIRTGRQSDRATKEIQLQQMKKWHEEVLVYKEEVEEVGSLAQQVLEEGRSSSKMNSVATLLASRYQAVRLYILEQTQFLEEEIRNIDESDSALKFYTDWFEEAQNSFKNVTSDLGVMDKMGLERKIKKLEVFRSDMDVGHRLLKSAREKGERVLNYLAGSEAEQLEKDLHSHVENLEDLTSSIRKEHTALEKGFHLAKEFSDKHEVQAQWLSNYQSILQTDVEPKTELYEKKAQLAKYKSIQQTVLSHEPSIKLVIEKGEALFSMTYDATVREKIQKLQKDYQGLCHMAKTSVSDLEDKVKEHEAYNSELQDVEKWLLHMSNRLVTPDLMEGSNLETITQQLANHKAMMEDIAGFEERLNSLKLKGETLVLHCAEHLQGKFKQNIQAHLQGTRDSYSAICSTVQRVYLSLENELQKHVSHQDTLLQCQAWLASVQKDIEPGTKAPLSLAEATKQAKHFRTLQEQANTYLDLLCTACDLSDGAVKNVAINVQQTKQTIEQRMMVSQDLANGWEEVKHLKMELQAYFQEAGQQIQNMKRRRAELEIKLAENMVSQLKEFSQKLQSQQDKITSFTEKVNQLTNGQESLEHTDIGHLNNRWLDFCFQVNNLLQQREEDLQKTRDYHDRLSIVDVFLEKLTTEWDNLARSDTESTAAHLEALKSLAFILQERRFALEDLKEQKQKVTEHLDADDKELVKEQTNHFEQRWTQLEDLVKNKIQTCATTLEQLRIVHSHLQDLTEWAEDQQPSISEALKQSPPPELAQNLLMDHLTICSEVETKQLLLKNLIKDVDKIMGNLGLNERQQLQRALIESQKHVDCLNDLVSQRKRHLNKALSERAQFLMAAYQALRQIQQHGKKVIFQEYICLHPDDVGKQIRTCKNAQAGLKAYQVDINSLWNQGRELMKEATEQEKTEVLGKLQELQIVYDSVLQKCGQRLIELEKSLVSRKHFKEDLDKSCHWIKQADVLTFPEINLMNDDSELYSQLSKYQQLLEQAPEYENLLLSLQQKGQEILASLNEVDYSYLDEKLNTLPQQCNYVVKLAREKLGKVQEAIFMRKEYVSLIDLTSKALKELEDHFLLMNKVPPNLLADEALALQQDYSSLLNEVVTLGTAVNELNQKKEIFRSTGQPWLPEEMLQVVSQYHKLRRMIEQKVSQLADTTDAYRSYEDLCSKLNIKLEALSKELEQVNVETLPAEDKLKSYRTLAANLQDAGTLLRRITEQLEEMSSVLEPSACESANMQIQQWCENLKLWNSVVKEKMAECENRFMQSIDFFTEICRILECLRQTKVELNEPVLLDGKLENIQEEIRKLQIQQEETMSSLRIINALCLWEKQKYLKAKEFVPADLENSMAELAELEKEINEGITGKQINLDKMYIASHRYHQAVQSASDWLQEAQKLLQQNENGVDIEEAEESLKVFTEFFSTEKKFNGLLDELRSLVSELEVCGHKTEQDHLKQVVASLKKKGKETKEQGQVQLDLLRRCTVQWNLYQEERHQVIMSLNEAEKKLFKFSVTKDASCHKAEEKFLAHKTLVTLVNSFHEKITTLEDKASAMEKLGDNASKATISKSMTTVWQRWTRLRSTAREQERILGEAVQEWKELSNKIQKSSLAIDQLQENLPESYIEKATKTELIELLENHETFCRELEQEFSAVSRLRQHALNGVLRDAATEPAACEDLPVIQEVKAMLDRCSNMQQKVKKSKKLVEQELKEREDVEKELNAVKAWIKDTQDNLLNTASETDMQIEDWQSLQEELNSYRHKVEKLSEEQQNKYLEMYAILPSELSLLLAEVALALANVNEEIQMKQKEAQQNQVLYQELSQQAAEVEQELNIILEKLNGKANDVSQARKDHKTLCEELDKCNIKLVELDAAVQDFSEQNHTQAKQLVDKVGSLTELQQQASKEAEYKTSRVKQAATQLEEYNEMLEFILRWIGKAKILVHGHITWNSSSQLRDQAITHQAMLDESRDIRSDLEAMNEKIDYLSSVFHTEGLIQQVSELGRETEKLQQSIKQRMQSLYDAAEDMKKFESKVRALQTALAQAQSTLTSPELGRLSLKEQLSHRQHLLSKMESLKPKVQAVQHCQSSLRIPEEVVTSLPICRTAVRLLEETSRLQHTAIQQCNIMQEAVVQYEQYEQEMKHLQHLIEEAHRELQDAKVTTNNIQELQIQIKRHEELAKKIKGYQDQIASLNSKCKMLTMKAKHATMLLTVTEVEGLTEGMEELDAELLPAHSAHPSVVMMTAGRCHTLLSPVTEESGEEGTNSEISSPPACRSPSPVANTDASVNQDIAYYQALSAEQLQTDAAKIQPNTASPQEMYESGIETAANAKLDDLQRSWETLKNVISEKQRTLYEALERQQRYQDALQSISTKMEAVEVKLNESLEPSKTPESQMAEHQALMDEILMLQEEISKLQASFADELVSESLDSEAADQLALQSTLTVLAERMATIRMKASGKRQLLEEKLNEQLEEQRHEQALQRYRSEADELDHWLLGARSTLEIVLRALEEPVDMEAQLIDCQNMLLEIEQKVVALSELSVHSENLLMEGKTQTKEEAEQLAIKLRTLKGSLLELQRVLQDKQISIQGTFHEKEESEAELSSSQSPSVQEWLAQTRTTRSLQKQNSLQKQKELEQELAEQKKLLQSVASRGGEIINQQTTTDRTNISNVADSLSRELGLEGVKSTSQEQMRMKWESLHQELSTKEKLIHSALQQEQEQPIFSQTNRIIPGVPFYKGDKQVQDKSSVVNILDGLNQALEDVSSQTVVGEKKIIPLEKKLYDAISATSTWLDDVEEGLFVQTALQPEETETCLYHQETLAKDIKEMSEEMDKNKNLFLQTLPSTGGHQEIIEDTLYCLLGRLNSLESVVNHRCNQMKERLQDLLTFQNDLKMLFTSLADNKYIILHKLAEAAERPAKEQMQGFSPFVESSGTLYQMGHIPRYR